MVVGGIRSLLLVKEQHQVLHPILIQMGMSSYVTLISYRKNTLSHGVITSFSFASRARFAFNPKDVKLNRFATNASSSPSKPTEREIKERINRLSQTLENKVRFYATFPFE